MLRTTDEMRRTGQTGWADRRIDGRTGAQADEGSEWTSRQVGGQANGLADGRTSGWGRARWADNGRTGGLADGGGWADDEFLKVKLPI